MNEKTRRLLIIPAILVGVVALRMMARGREGAPRVDNGERATPVRFIEVQPLDVVPRAIGYGSVRPAHVWTAVSEVTGRVAELPDRVRAGARIEAGELLLRIDGTDYALALAEAEANIQATEALLLQLEAQEQNVRASLMIEEASLASAAKELERIRSLAQQGTASTSQVEAQERAYLGQKQSVQNLKNSLELLPADRAAKRAQLAQQQARRQQTQRNLERTTIVAPFNARLADITVERDQYVRQGEVLAVLDDMDEAEIEAQFPTSHFTQLVPALDMGELLARGLRPGPEMLHLTAVVHTLATDTPVDWPARFMRLNAGVDPQTRTIGVVVAVDEPYARAMPPHRPPLVKGLYVAVELEGAPRPAQLAIPRDALHGTDIYVITPDDRLERRAVEVDLRQDMYVTVRSGITAGERLVVSDLIPAIDGMLLVPVPDTAVAAELRAATAGSLEPPG